jgi:hypothetical protein
MGETGWRKDTLAGRDSSWVWGAEDFVLLFVRGSGGGTVMRPTFYTSLARQRAAEFEVAQTLTLRERLLPIRYALSDEVLVQSEAIPEGQG